MSQIEQLAREVLRHYPRIYIACHADHKSRRGQGAQITARDQTILAHIPNSGVRAQTLARHLDIAPSTLSAALKRLSKMELTSLEPERGDARARVVSLAEKGRAALAATSVLDVERVCAALKKVSSANRDAIVKGLSLLADAAIAAKEEK